MSGHVKRVIAWQIAEEMKARQLTKAQLAAPATAAAGLAGC